MHRDRPTRPLPLSEGRAAYLTRCARNARTRISLDAGSFWGRLSAAPGASRAQVVVTREVALGAAFREGSALAAGVGLDRARELIPSRGPRAAPGADTTAVAGRCFTRARDTAAPARIHAM